MIERWSHIEWDNDDVGILDKKIVFFEGVAQIKRDIEDSKSRDLMVFFDAHRVYAQNVAPDFASPAPGPYHRNHVICCRTPDACPLGGISSHVYFAAVAEWRFGIFRKEFGDFKTALASEVTMFFSPLRDGKTSLR